MFLSYVPVVTRALLCVITPFQDSDLCPEVWVCAAVLWPQAFTIHEVPLGQNQNLGALIPKVAHLQHKPTGKVYDPNLWLRL